MKKTLIIGDKLGTPASKFSTKIADEAIKRGYQVFECEAIDVAFESSKVFANAQQYPSGESGRYEIKDEFNNVHFRPNPPVDMQYMTLLYVLRLIEDDVLILNRPSGIINFPEKIFPHILGDYSPPSLISQDINEIKNFAEKYTDIIAKPLYGFGGFDIKKLTASGVDDELAAGINIYQEFMPEVAQGTVRVNLLNGEICGYFLKIPPKDSIESNFFKDDGLATTELTDKQKEVCEILKPICKKEGLFFCGLDFIGDTLLEVNDTSAGVLGVKEVCDIDTEIEYWNALENL